MNRTIRFSLLLVAICAALNLFDTVYAQTDSNEIIQNTESADTSTAVYPLSPERKAKLVSYSQFNNVWRFADFFIGLGLLAILMFTGLSAKLRTFAQRAKYKIPVWWLYFILFVVVMYLISFPFDFYREYIVELNYGFLNQTFGEWMFDSLKGLMLSAIFGFIPFWFVYFVIEKSRQWWLWFGIGSIPIFVIFIVIAPVFISPMFNDFTELKDKVLESKILTLASKAGIEGSDVFEVDASKQSSKVNAYVTGLFNTKRIVLYDTIIKNFEDDELLYVMGHEMGHYVMNHVWYALVIIVIFVMFALWVTNKLIHKFIWKFKNKMQFSTLADIASLPVLLLFVGIISFVSQPVTNGLSRSMEHQADVFGMKVTDVSGESAAIAFDKLSAFNLSDPDPNPLIEFWFYDHPALKKRMEFVRSYRK